MHSDTRLKSRTSNREHLDRLAQLLTPKLAWGALNTVSDDLALPSKPECILGVSR